MITISILPLNVCHGINRMSVYRHKHLKRAQILHYTKIRYRNQRYFLVCFVVILCRRENLKSCLCVYLFKVRLTKADVRKEGERKYLVDLPRLHSLSFSPRNEISARSFHDAHFLAHDFSFRGGFSSERRFARSNTVSSTKVSSGKSWESYESFGEGYCGAIWKVSGWSPVPQSVEWFSCGNTSFHHFGPPYSQVGDRQNNLDCCSQILNLGFTFISKKLVLSIDTMGSVEEGYHIRIRPKTCPITRSIVFVRPPCSKHLQMRDGKEGYWSDKQPIAPWVIWTSDGSHPSACAMFLIPKVSH